jgi:hypothetical protein
VKLKVILVTLVATAGFAASYALADNGNQNGDSHCHGAVLGTMAAPQSLTVTVRKSRPGGFTAGQVVTLSVGSSGQTLRVVAEGCVGTNGTLTVRGALLHVMGGNGDNHHEGTTTETTSHETTSDETTSTGTTTNDDNND